MTTVPTRAARVLAVALVAAGLAPATPARAVAPWLCDGKAATIVGTVDEDRIVGTAGPDVIVGLAGRDHIDGRGGDDRICGGQGPDSLQGGAGDDRLFGEQNSLYADRGGTTIIGDVLDGGPGDDFLDVGPNNRNEDYVMGERVEFLAAPGAVTVDLAAGTATGQGRDVIRHVRGMKIRTGAADDTILGTRWGDIVDSGPGNDTVTLFGGADTFLERRTSLPDDDVVDTGAGGDSVKVFSGADRISTGKGSDGVDVNGRGPHAVDTGPAPDSVFTLASDVSGSSYDLGPGAGNYLSLEVGVLRDVEGALPIRIDVPAGLLTITLPDGPVSARINGIEEYVLGKEFRIDFLGGDADESLFVAPLGSIALRAVMGGGDDSVWGSRSADHLDGGDGVDTAWADDGDDTCLQIEEANDC